ncbi:LysR family transcriptional regulator [Paenibacillus piri]|uniref:LysR family transcriptional regulator n=1 Tax=Paenibacillus piri TaxID=2547395 RepID=A0A4V2ZTW2_9BACL|nr:LysR family transcriptional regulator [Paenibacillus piri]TDF98684.1 LysR family transcriptional regulator [Paenibacillus piri]
MNLQQLRVFVLTVNYKKLTLVAEKLKISQPTVTFHLNKLQEQIGVPLFLSSSNRLIRLTDVGESFYHYAKQMIGMEDEMLNMVDEFRGLQRGRIAIGSTYTPATYILPQYLSLFMELHPHVTISLEVNIASRLLDMLNNFELDVAIMPHYRWEHEEGEYFITPLARDDLILILSPGHPLAGMREVGLDHLRKLAIIMHEKKSVSRELIDQWSEANRLQLQSVLEVSATETMKEMVKKQLGAAILSQKSCEREIGSGELIAFPLPSFPASRHIYMVRKKEKLPTPAIKAFLDCITRDA